MKKVNYIGVIVYKNYEENVTLSNLDITTLNEIMFHDNDALCFQIRKIDTNQVVYTYNVSRETKREIEHLGTTFNAYSNPMYKQHCKITWSNRTGNYRTKKLAEQKRLEYNNENFNKLNDRCSFYMYR